MNASLTSAVATMEAGRLRGLRARLEAVLLARFQRGNGTGTQADLRTIEVMTAIGAELLAREDRRVRPFDTCWVDGFRLSFQIRVF
jgi:hypothetical protein